MAHVVTGELYFQIDGQLHEIKRQLRQESGYPYSPYQLKTALQAAIEGNFANVDTYHVTINYKGSVEEMVKRGKYDWSNCEITSEYFPSDQDGDAEVCIELIRFERTMGSSEVLEELDSRGLRPASLRELLALGEQHPEAQRKFPIVALGSVWYTSHRNVVCLWEHLGHRECRINWFEFRWSSLCRFAVVRK